MTADEASSERTSDGQPASAGDDRQYVVRCGVMRALCVLQSRQLFQHGDRVLCRTPRGTEVGEVLCEATPARLEQIEDPPAGSIVRRLSDQDRAEMQRMSELTDHDFAVCERRIDALQLKMELVEIERVLGGERVVVYYLADQRVDFRQLVRDLASDLKTRVEMRQIGVRDEAKLLADYGDCGKPVCCNTHLTKMPPVSMKMAKLQKATLDPAKISGRCGRLKCCLRYEYDTYDQLRRELPPPGSRVITRNGQATVLQQEILSQQLLVQTEDDRRILIPADDVLTVISRGGKKKGGSAGSAKRPPTDNG